MKHTLYLVQVTMACVRGRCPCWPQPEPFDFAEMALLDAVHSFVMTVPSAVDELLWARIQTKCQAVRGHRRAYVLSTPIAHGGDTRYHYAVTIIGWATCMTVEQVEWLLNLRVCPNISGACRSRQPLGWTNGPKHPGRPSQDTLFGPLARCALIADGDTKKLLFLSAGAYSWPRSLHGLGVPRDPAESLLRRQWHAWHGRASRRLWTAVAAHVGTV